MRFLLPVLLLFPLRAFSQDFFNFLSPESPSTSIELEGAYLPSSEVEHGADKTQIIHRAVGVNQKIYEDEKRLVTVGAKSSKLELPTHGRVLRDFYNQQGSVAYKRKLSGDKFWLASASYGSASDRPFRNGRDGTLGLNYIQKISDKWFIAGNYSNNRPFLNNVPLPGFFYIKEMTKERSFVIGFPFIFWSRPLGEQWSIRYFGLLPWTHRLKILYSKSPFFMPYFGFEQSPQTFFRHDREERFNRFFWFERRVGPGIEGRLNRTLKYDLSTGLAFDRQFFEARNFSQSKEYLLNVENAYFVAFNLRLNF